MSPESIDTTPFINWNNRSFYFGSHFGRHLELRNMFQGTRWTTGGFLLGSFLAITWAHEQNYVYRQYLKVITIKYCLFWPFWKPFWQPSWILSIYIYISHSKNVFNLSCETHCTDNRPKKGDSTTVTSSNMRSLYFGSHFGRHLELHKILKNAR